MHLLLIPLIVFTSALLALAQSPQDSGPGGQFLPPPDPLTLALDANGDRELSAEEISKATEQLKILDRNRDGSLTEEELFPRPFDGPPSFGRSGGMGPNRQEQKLAGKYDADKKFNCSDRKFVNL